ncbi:hypothetical protein [Sediminibacillus albus]|nr:hypothetical protein [Sediminibacillus albus]
MIELSTDSPGFAIEGDLSNLGQSFKLPGWLEEERTDIIKSLPSLKEE